MRHMKEEKKESIQQELNRYQAEWEAKLGLEQPSIQRTVV